MQLESFKRSSIIALLLSCLVLIFCNCGTNAEIEFHLTDDHELEEKARDLLSQMTLEEKIEQMSGSREDYINGLLAQYDPNGTSFNRLGIPEMVYRDGPRGARSMNNAMVNSTAFPVAALRASSWDTDLENRIGKAIADEVRAMDAHVLLAPTINQVMNPRHGRCQETYGEDSFLLGTMGVAFIKGVQSDPPEGMWRVQSCVKHFAANNIENTREEVNAEIDERTLREVYLPHFKMAIDEANVASFMGSYNRVNGVYSCMNEYLLRDILKGEWGFTGYVISDWFAVTDTVDSVRAGLDVEMPFSNPLQLGDTNPYAYGTNLTGAVNNGLVSEDLIDEAVLRILIKKLEYGVIDHPWGSDGVERNENAIDEDILSSVDHASLAREAAEKGIVLLENRNSTLPLNRTSLNGKTIAVVGRYSDTFLLRNQSSYAGGNLYINILTGDIGSSWVSPYDNVPIGNDCTFDANGDVTNLGTLDYDRHAVSITKGIEYIANRESASITVNHYDTVSGNETAISNADYVIVVTGYVPNDLFASMGSGGNGEEGEYKDRSSLELNAYDKDNVNNALSKNSNVIVVLQSGGAVIVEDFIGNGSLKALIMAWYPGMQGGIALAKILFGDVNPGGKLCQSFPKKESDLPAFDNTSMNVAYGYYHGYRYLEKHGITPRYYFGYGKSYSTFSYSDINILNDDNTVPEDGTLTAAIEVTNNGPYNGDEIVQLYIAYPNTRVDDTIGRPTKELKAFKRVSIASGATETVTLEVPASKLAYYNTDTESWVIEKVDHEVYIGPSSDRNDPNMKLATFKVSDSKK